MEINWLDEDCTNETKNVMKSSYGKEFKKIYSDIKKQSRADIKKDYCMLCGEKCTSFCQSHTVPRFVLKNISLNGKMFLFNALAENAFIEDDTGISNAGNFYLICNKCDNTVFHDYEDEFKLENMRKDNSRVYCEIALKNLIKAVYKRELEIAQYKIIIQKANNKTKELSGDFLTTNLITNSCKHIEQKIHVSKLDLYEYNEEIIRCKKMIDKIKNSKTSLTNNCYNIIDVIFINHTVPIAYQGVITLIADTEGNVINDIYCDDQKYKQELLHLCIFPLHGSSLITLFTHKSNRRYSSFKTHFLSLSLDKKLALINYILFLYSEDMFLSGYLDINSLKNAEFQKVIRLNPTDNFDITSKNNLKKIALHSTLEKFSLNNYDKVVNLLSPEYSMETLKCNL